MSKAATLQALQALLHGEPPKFVVDAFVAFTVGEWRDDPEGVLGRIDSGLCASRLIVRSSTVAERSQGSTAGAFRSMPGIPRERVRLREAIASVVASYSRRGRVSPPEDRVIVQEEVLRPRLAGVLTTIDDNSLPYMTIAFDTSGSTNAVTQGQPSRIVRLRRGSDPPQEWLPVVEAAQQVCHLLGDDDQVIEFAEDQAGVVHVFQAWSRGRIAEATAEEIGVRESSVWEAFTKLGLPMSSTMSDWNPAEILGRHPSRLAVSLYDTLVTERVWSRARAHLGYWRPSGGLMFVLDGTPYINVARSLASLTPRSLRPETRREIVEVQLEVLASDPTLHDKVEWRVAISCAAIHPDPRLDCLRQPVRAELKTELVHLTNEILRTRIPARSADEHTLFLTRARRQLGRRPLTPEGIAQSLATIRDHGTAPFAVHARLAFLLRDLVEQGIHAGALPQRTMGDCLRLARTGASDLETALNALLDDPVNTSKFLATFGHLRPAAYEVESPRYDDPGVLALMLHHANSERPHPISTPPELPQTGDFTTLLKHAGIQVDGRRVLEGLAAEMSERERLKFHFTGLLSDLLEHVAELGERRGLTRKQVATLTTGHLIKDSWEPVQSSWRLPMPDILTASTRLDFVELGTEQPTFAGSGAFSGRPLVVGRDFLSQESLAGCVVLMESAEPGCDWIFSTGMGALVTAYGGSASHMAIRAAEMGLPTAVGCGPETLKRLASARRVLIDAERKLLNTEV